MAGEGRKKYIKREIILFLVRDLNGKRDESVFKGSKSDVVTLETPNSFRNSSRQSYEEKLDIKAHSFQIPEGNGFENRDSIKTCKVRKPRRKNSSKRYAVNFQKKSLECFEGEKDKVLLADENNCSHNNENSEFRVLGRFEVLTTKSEFHHISVA